MRERASERARGRGKEREREKAGRERGREGGGKGGGREVNLPRGLAGGVVVVGVASARVLRHMDVREMRIHVRTRMSAT